MASGAKQEVGTPVDPMDELVAIKCMEMFAEAIPGVIIQLMAIAAAAKGEKISTVAWLSLALSALTTGFASATVSYDFDVDPGHRERFPKVYGKRFITYYIVRHHFQTLLTPLL